MCDAKVSSSRGRSLLLADLRRKAMKTPVYSTYSIFFGVSEMQASEIAHQETG
jgi:hypothetical protein